MTGYDSNTSEKNIVEVSITSDLMCPWCWIGLRKLQEASIVSGVPVNITWKPFMLRPNIPLEGQPKGGTPESRAGSRLKQAGREVGIDFTGLTDRAPNTLPFHATMAMLYDNASVDKTTVNKFHEAVFEGYFTLGIYPDRNGLIACAEKVGVATHVRDFFGNNERYTQYSRKAGEEAKEASVHGVSGVPSFEFNGEPVFSGAQPIATFSHFLIKYAK